MNPTAAVSALADDPVLRAAAARFDDPTVGVRLQANLDALGRLLELEQPDAAAVCALRAFRLSGHKPQLAQPVAALLDDQGRHGAALDILRHGLLSASRSGQVDATLTLYAAWRHHAARTSGVEVYDFDHAVLDGLRRLGNALALPPAARPPTVPEPRRRKVAYIGSSLTQPGSVLAKLMLDLMTHHDGTQTDYALALCEPPPEIDGAPQARALIDLMGRRGMTVLTSAQPGAGGRLVEVARTLTLWAPDLIVTNAALARAEAYVLRHALPHVPACAQVVGPPPLFTAPDFALSVASDERLRMECPGPAALVRVEVTQPDPAAVRVTARDGLGIPDTAPVLVLAGRHVKYSPRLRAVVAEVLRRVPRAWALLLGLGEPHATAFLTGLGDGAARARAIGWTPDYLGSLRLGDLMIDTFPSGGGVALMDAMALGIPAIAFADTPWREYRADQWSMAHEFVLPELVVPTDDDAAMAALAARLLADDGERLALAARCRAHVIARRGHPERMTRGFEAAYDSLLRPVAVTAT